MLSRGVCVLRTREQLDPFIVDALSFGHVAYDRDRQGGLVINLQRTQTDLGRKFAAVFTPAGQGLASTHRAWPWRQLIGSAQPRVAGSKAPRDERFDGLAKQFVARVAEQPLCLSVHQADPTPSIHNHERVRRRLEYGLHEGITTHFGRQ